MRIPAGMPELRKINHVEYAPGAELATGLRTLVLHVEFEPRCPAGWKPCRVWGDGERQDRSRNMPSLGEVG